MYGIGIKQVGITITICGSGVLFYVIEVQGEDSIGRVRIIVVSVLVSSDYATIVLDHICTYVSVIGLDKNILYVYTVRIQENGIFREVCIAHMIRFCLVTGWFCLYHFYHVIWGVVVVI